MKYLVAILCLGSLTIATVDAIGTRIIGGAAAYAGQFPFAAAVTVQTSNSRIFCGGTLIDRQWVLTAGQCVDGAVVFTVALGSNKLSESDANRVTLSTNDYVLHPDYNPETLDNDVGLIKLRLPVEFTGYLNKVDYLGSHYVVDTTSAMALGWGQTSDDSAQFSEDLQWTMVAALTNDDCRLTYGNQISNATLCVDGNYNQGSCYGDTGGGLIQKTGMYKTIVGIASFVSYNGCESPDPSGYVRVSEYVDWINSVIKA